MTPLLPWRSLLYVPAHKETFVAKAATRGADGIILDLEDGVPPVAKEQARHGLADAAARIGASGVPVLVRVNAAWALAWRDLEAAVAAGIPTVLVPKVEDAGRVGVIAAYLSELEVTLGSPTPTRLIPLIESARGLCNADAILSATPRICAIIPGNEDLAADLGVEPEPERMLHIQSPLLLAARAAGVGLLGLIGSGSNFKDLDAYRQRAAFAKAWGFEGATCIHPDQVLVLNEVFSPNAAEVARARAVVQAFAAAGGEPTSLDGVMVDRPVVERAQRLLERARS
jgi:citrate lyase subunit beta / citryl-CoA lyase